MISTACRKTIRRIITKHYDETPHEELIFFKTFSLLTVHATVLNHILYLDASLRYIEYRYIQFLKTSTVRSPTIRNLQIESGRWGIAKF